MQGTRSLTRVVYNIFTEEIFFFIWLLLQDFKKEHLVLKIAFLSQKIKEFEGRNTWPAETYRPNVSRDQVKTKLLFWKVTKTVCQVQIESLSCHTYVNRS